MDKPTTLIDKYPFMSNLSILTQVAKFFTKQTKNKT
jgi:hypothetical protein